MGTCAHDIKHQVKTNTNNTKKSATIKRTNTFDEWKVQEIVFGCFDKFDKNHDGYLDCQEIMSLLKHSYLMSSGNCVELPLFFFKDAAEELLRKAGQGSDDRISRENFYRFYRTA